MKRSALLIVLLLGIVALSACSSGSAEYTVTATDLAYDKDRLEATAGQPVQIVLQNQGSLQHDFSIMEMPHTGEIVVEEETGDMDEHDMEMSEMGIVPEIHVATPAGGSGTIQFTPSQPGEYEFFCTVPGHKEAGMVGTLVVKES